MSTLESRDIVADCCEERAAATSGRSLVFRAARLKNGGLDLAGLDREGDIEEGVAGVEEGCFPTIGYGNFGKSDISPLPVGMLSLRSIPFISDLLSENSTFSID